MPAVIPTFMVTLVEAICVQDEPSAEYDAVKVLPARDSFTHCGGTGPLTQPATLTVLAPVAERTSIATPLVGVRRTEASMELVASDSRIITPALAKPAVCCSVATRAMTSTSPE